MDLEIEQEGTGPVDIVTGVPESLVKYLVPSARAICIRGDGFEALMQELQGEGFSAWYSIYDMKKRVVLRARGNIAVLELRIALKGMIRGTWDLQSVPELPECYFQLGFTPHVATRAVFEEGIYETFDIQFTLPFLEKLGIDYHLLDVFINKVLSNHPAELSAYPFRCTLRMQDSVNTILHNRYSEAGKKRLLSNAVTAILLEALETVGAEDKTMQVLTKWHIDKMYDVRALILADFPKYRGAAGLCTEVSISEPTLNYGFNQVFGMKPNQYYQHLRFEKAKELLREGHRVSEVAHELDYIAASHFITMFKAKFGYTPKEFQKRSL